jgi:tetratricopeptide (TPR) repeat protein
VVHVESRELEPAGNYFKQALTIYIETSDSHGQATTLGNLGNVQYLLGNFRIALHYHQQHFELARTIGDKLGVGNAMWNSSLALNALGQREGAIDQAEKALTIYQQIESPHSVKVAHQLTQWRLPG